jgi:hypothetical protein
LRLFNGLPQSFFPPVPLLLEMAKNGQDISSMLVNCCGLQVVPVSHLLFSVVHHLVLVLLAKLLILNAVVLILGACPLVVVLLHHTIILVLAIYPLLPLL